MVLIFININSMLDRHIATQSPCMTMADLNYCFQTMWSNRCSQFINSVQGTSNYPSTCHIRWILTFSIEFLISNIILQCNLPVNCSNISSISHSEKYEYKTDRIRNGLVMSNILTYYS
jgi:hypothetical protein